MIKPAFSTVALPDWTLRRIQARLEAWGFLGVELRTFGNGSRTFACDPALSSPAKTRAMVASAGMDVCSLATGIRYDEVVSPPVIGRVFADTERSVRETKGMVDLAVRLECPFVRVFGFELPEGERRANGLARVVERLVKAVDYCRNSGVKLMIENGGSFDKASDLAEIIERVGSPLLVAAYSLPVGAAAGDGSVREVLSTLGDRLVCVKVKDLKGGKPVALGEGDLRVVESIQALAATGFDGWLVYEFDRAWLTPADAAPDVDAILGRSAAAMYRALGGSGAPGTGRRSALTA